MTQPSINDVGLFATGDSMIMQQCGLAFHRRDVAQLVAPCTVTDVRDKKGSWPLTVQLSDGSALVAVANELTVLVNAAPVETADAPQDVDERTERSESSESSELARAVAA